ncbi:type II toxin-antitoxin system RelE/ParE family toxin [Pseudomonas sp. JUb42]|uniref:type II toxin-antitoxin system RelE/ParE family toxin n=1 Tax=Pseudomonas sp. JUb42 TaxID=2940611 RepID=UPI00286E435E|nr:type II toxin-antitoxin system RelE/ParE family toxin [Pseudomonas sp. JUb42]
MKRCQQFLAEKAPEAAKRAGQAIMRQFRQLETSPDIGRPFADLPELRELMIAFGDSGYVALYRHEPDAVASRPSPRTLLPTPAPPDARYRPSRGLPEIRR